jgi:flagellar hook-basal body complex protein FliE
MIDPTSVNLNLPGVGGVKAGGGADSISSTPGSGASFADALKKSIGEVSRMQQDASSAVNDLATGKSQDVSGVMTAVEKSDLAFKTLLAIRAKLMDAYEEIKGISV